MFQEPATRRVWLFRDNIETLYKDKDGWVGGGRKVCHADKWHSNFNISRIFRGNSSYELYA